MVRFQETGKQAYFPSSTKINSSVLQDDGLIFVLDNIRQKQQYTLLIKQKFERIYHIKSLYSFGQDVWVSFAKKSWDYYNWW